MVITVALAAVVLAVGMTFSGGVQTSLLITSLVIAFVGAMIAAFRTFRSWQARGRWQFWQGAMWFLMFFTLVLMMGVIPVLTDGLGVI